MAYTKVVSNKSPWLAGAVPGEVYAIPISHGEGRFVASDEWIKKLFAAGCVATQYVDLDGNPTMDEDFNPNASYAAIEGITSLTDVSLVRWDILSESVKPLPEIFTAIRTRRFLNPVWHILNKSKIEIMAVPVLMIVSTGDFISFGSEK